MTTPTTSPALVPVTREIPPASAVLIVKDTDIPAQRFVGEDEIISTLPIPFVMVTEAER